MLDLSFGKLFSEEGIALIHYFVNINFRFRFNITSTGCELAEKLLNGLQENFNFPATHQQSDIQSNSTSEEIMNSLHNIVNELNESNYSGSEHDKVKSRTSQTSNAVRMTTMRPGSLFARLQANLNNKSKDVNIAEPATSNNNNNNNENSNNRNNNNDNTDLLRYL